MHAMRLNRPGRNGRRALSRGSIMVYLMLVMSVLVTGATTTLAIAMAAQSKMNGLTLRRDKAYYAAEAGLQRAMWELEYGSWKNVNVYPTLTGTCGDGSYTVTATGTWNSPALVQSVGSVSGYSDASVACSASFPPKSVVPAIAVGGNLQVGGGANIVGDIQVRGSISHNGNFTIQSGNIIATGSIDTKNTAIDSGYGFYPNSSNVTIPVIDAVALANTPGAAPLTNANNVDFTQSSSGIIVWNTATQGNLTLDNWPNIKGSGTLVVLGPLSSVLTIGKVDFGTSQINIVTQGQISTQPQCHLNGSMYAGGAITAQAQLQVTGVIVSGDTVAAGQVLDTWQGQTQITIAPPPSFDPRVQGGSGSRTLSSFTGPTF